MIISFVVLAIMLGLGIGYQIGIGNPIPIERLSRGKNYLIIGITKISDGTIILILENCLTKTQIITELKICQLHDQNISLKNRDIVMVDRNSKKLKVMGNSDEEFIKNTFYWKTTKSIS